MHTSSMKKAKLYWSYNASPKRIKRMIGARRYKQMTEQYFNSACWSYES